MKKHKINIPKPCHEDWNKMTQEEKGRFCGVCNKTVIDFTQMSEQEVEAFFKKPAVSLCGRFRKEQLKNTKVLQKHNPSFTFNLFRYTWPALVLFMKSCSEQEPLIGDIVTTEENVSQRIYKYTTMGLVISEISPSTDAEKNIESDRASNDSANIMGELAFADSTEIIESVNQFVINNTDITSDVNNDSLETSRGSLFVQEKTAHIDTAKYDNGQIVSNTSSATIDSRIPVQKNQVIVFPNPIRAGSMLKIIMPDKSNHYKQLQIHYVNGQHITTEELSDVTPYTFISIGLPYHLSSGTYVVQLIDKTGHVSSIKFLVVAN